MGNIYLSTLQNKDLLWDEDQVYYLGLVLARSRGQDRFFQILRRCSNGCLQVHSVILDWTTMSCRNILGRCRRLSVVHWLCKLSTPKEVGHLIQLKWLNSPGIGNSLGWNMQWERSDDGFIVIGCTACASLVYGLILQTSESVGSWAVPHVRYSWDMLRIWTRRKELFVIMLPFRRTQPLSTIELK